MPHGGCKQLPSVDGPDGRSVVFNQVFQIADDHHVVAAILFVPSLFGYGPKDVDMTGIIL
jgi:hypothetical protein